MDDKNRLNDGEKPQTPADREAKAKRRILVGIAAGALLVVGLITGGVTSLILFRHDRMKQTKG